MERMEEPVRQETDLGDVTRSGLNIAVRTRMGGKSSEKKKPHSGASWSGDRHVPEVGGITWPNTRHLCGRISVDEDDICLLHCLVHLR